MTDGVNDVLRILIIAHAFPPLNSTASHRPYSWASEWRDLGHEVHVLTPMKYSFDGMLDLQRDLSGIKVHEVAYLPARRNASRTGGETGKRGVLQWEWLKTMTRRARFSLAMFGDARLMAYWPLLRRGLRLAREQPFDLIIATSPPEVLFFVARALSRRTGVQWVADYRDLWFRDMRLYQSRLASWLSGPVNRWLARTASALVTVSRGLQERLSRYLDREVLLSYNGYFESDRTEGAAASCGDGKIHLVYTGRLYPEKRDPAPLFRALAVLRESAPALAARLVVDFYGFDEPWLRSLIEKHAVGANVRLHGFVSYGDSVAAQRAADMLLFLDWTDIQAEGVLTGKLFEYLASGRPILALGRRRDSEAARVIADAGCGILLASDDDIVGYLSQLASSSRPAPIESRNIERFSRERQARELLEVLRSRLPSRTAAMHSPEARP